MLASFSVHQTWRGVWWGQTVQIPASRGSSREYEQCAVHYNLQRRRKVYPTASSPVLSDPLI